MSEPPGENVGRLKSKLRRHAPAMAALRAMGVNGATLDRLHLGLKEPYRSRSGGTETRDALCFPVLSEGLRPIGRYAYMNLPGVTEGAQAATTWGPGPPLVYRLGSFAADATAVVAAEVADVWLAWQMSRGGNPEVAFLSRSHATGWPSEWKAPEFWAGFSRVVVLPGVGAEDFLRDVAPRVGRTVVRGRLPEPHASIRDAAVSSDPPPFDRFLEAGEAWTQAVPAAAGAVPAESLGRFAAAPVSITGAFAGGHLFYPVAVERRGLEGEGRASARVVHSYSTMVVRSDGHLLTSELLPAPRGTPASQRVLALSDGTRILSEPVASTTATWSFGSIERFVAWRTQGGPAPFRPAAELATAVEAVIRERVWLPCDGHHQVAALYVMLSHLHQVCDVLPLLLIIGQPRTGRSELAESIARIGFNSTVAGQLRASGMMRLIDESRGLLVLDGMDGEGPASIFGNAELAQALRTSYRRSTSRKPVADRGGRVRTVDFFGPKVVVTSRDVDPVLGSRMIAIRSEAMPKGVALPGSGLDDEGLDAIRDELHCWGMASAADVAEACLRMAGVRQDRRREIAAPLRAVAAIVGGNALERLDWTLADGRSHP